MHDETLLMYVCFQWCLAHGRPQAWASGGTYPGNIVFCALVVTVKRSVDLLFMHYFHSFSSASKGFAPRLPPALHPWTSLANFSSPVLPQ